MQSTVLIVDDEKNTREGLRLALEEVYDVYTAANADEAFNLFEVESFDVVLTDLRMAGQSGDDGDRPEPWVCPISPFVS